MDKPNSIWIGGKEYKRLGHPPREYDVYRTIMINGEEYIGDDFTTGDSVHALAKEAERELQKMKKSGQKAPPVYSYTQKRNRASVERKMAPAESVKSLVIGDRTPNLNRFDIPNRICLTEITITENVTRIGKGTFASCTSLTSITIPDSVALICDCAFKNCTHLTQIVLPVGLKTIGHHLFWGCERLESITIPAGITRIDGYAFHKCAALKTVRYAGTQTQKEQIKIADGNDCLLNAEWICAQTESSAQPPEDARAQTRKDVENPDTKQRCENCEQPFRPGDRFCRKCGAQIGRDDATQPPENERSAEKPAPVIWSDNWTPCPRCDGYIGSDGTCDRCGLDTRRASDSIAAPSPKPVKEDSNESLTKTACWKDERDLTDNPPTST